MTTDQRIITAVRTGNGAYVDGTLIEELLKDTLASGLTINEFYGDKAYFRKSILEKIDVLEAQAYVPVSSSAYRIDESEFSDNKDSDQWFCSQGNETTTRKFRYRQKCGFFTGPEMSLSHMGLTAKSMEGASSFAYSLRISL